MSVLNSRRSMDPRWIVHHRSVPEGWMNADLIIQRVLADPVWDPDTNQLVDGGLEDLWSGRGRVQPNKDWRVRSVQSASDPQQDQYVRVQIPLRKNGTVPHLHTSDIIRAFPDENEDSVWFYDDQLEHYTFRVRNPINSSNPWVRNILCIADLSESGQPRPEAGS